MKYPIYENKKKMKAKNSNFLTLFLWMFFIQEIYADETCSSGMRKMYLDELLYIMKVLQEIMSQLLILMKEMVPYGSEEEF